MRLPDLKLSAEGVGAPSATRGRRSKKPPAPPPPPTGPTRAPALGFAFVVAVVLIGLTVLLSGCVRIEADLTSPAPDRMQLNWHVQSSSGQMLPWQKRFEKDLMRQRPEVFVSHQNGGDQWFETDPMSSAEMNRLLSQVLQIAGDSAGINLPPPEIHLHERNWLVGVDQRLNLLIDLRDVPPIPGFVLQLGLNQVTPKQQLFLGEATELNMHGWRWSPLGIGSLAIGLLLVLSLLLQGIRRRLGYGFPELPP